MGLNILFTKQGIFLSFILLYYIISNYIFHIENSIVGAKTKQTKQKRRNKQRQQGMYYFTFDDTLVSGERFRIFNNLVPIFEYFIGMVGEYDNDFPDFSIAYRLGQWSHCTYARHIFNLCNVIDSDMRANNFIHGDLKCNNILFNILFNLYQYIYYF